MFVEVCLITWTLNQTALFLHITTSLKNMIFFSFRWATVYLQPLTSRWSNITSSSVFSFPVLKSFYTLSWILWDCKMFIIHVTFFFQSFQSFLDFLLCCCSAVYFVLLQTYQMFSCRDEGHDNEEKEPKPRMINHHGKVRSSVKNHKTHAWSAFPFVFVVITIKNVIQRIFPNKVMLLWHSWH